MNCTLFFLHFAQIVSHPARVSTYWGLISMPFPIRRIVAAGYNEEARRWSSQMHLAASRKAPVKCFRSSESLNTMFHGNKNHISRIFCSQKARNLGSKSVWAELAASTESTSLRRWNSSNRAAHLFPGSMIRVNPVSSKLSFSKQWYKACTKINRMLRTFHCFLCNYKQPLYLICLAFEGPRASMYGPTYNFYEPH